MNLVPGESSEDEDWVQVQLQMPKSLLVEIDALVEQWGVRSRSTLVTRLLQEILLDAANEKGQE
jgi:metal-responsive CopG/Arc/MetJ family transcriptional regulator